MLLLLVPMLAVLLLGLPVHASPLTTITAVGPTKTSLSSVTPLPLEPYTTTICKPCTAEVCIMLCEPIETVITPTPIPYTTTVCAPCTATDGVCPAICSLVTTVVTPVPTTPYETVICEPCTAEICPLICRPMTTTITPTPSSTYIPYIAETTTLPQ